MTANNSNNGSSDVKDKIRAFILEYAADRGLKELKDDEPILTSNIIDSLGSFRMIGFLERTFPPKIKDTNMGPETSKPRNDCKTFVFPKMENPNGNSFHETAPAE